MGSRGRVEATAAAVTNVGGLAVVEATAARGVGVGAGVGVGVGGRRFTR